MRAMLPSIFNAFYVIIFVSALRKIHRKICMMFDDIVPVYKEDDEGWYAVRLYHKYFIYSDMYKDTARRLALEIGSEIPELRGQVEVVEHDDPEITLFENIPSLPHGAADKINDLYMEIED